MEKTKRILVEMSGMPFSAVIVGVGEDEDFDDMEELDADATVLKDKEGNAAVRDIVQFVKYSEFKELGMRELALEVLGEVPDQFVDYQVMTKELPEMLYAMKQQDYVDSGAPLDGPSPMKDVSQTNGLLSAPLASDPALEAEMAEF